MEIHYSYVADHGIIVLNHEVIIFLVIIVINLKNPVRILWDPQESLKHSMGSLSITASVALESLVAVFCEEAQKPTHRPPPRRRHLTERSRDPAANPAVNPANPASPAGGCGHTPVKAPHPVRFGKLSTGRPS